MLETTEWVVAEVNVGGGSGLSSVGWAEIFLPLCDGGDGGKSGPLEVNSQAIPFACIS